MLKKATAERNRCVKIAKDWDAFVEIVNSGFIAKVPWCESTESEIEIMGKAEMQGVKTLCILTDDDNDKTSAPTHKCFTGSGEDATCWCLWGKSY